MLIIVIYQKVYYEGLRHLIHRRVTPMVLQNHKCIVSYSRPLHSLNINSLEIKAELN